MTDSTIWSRRRAGTSACRETAVPQGRRSTHRAARNQPPGPRLAMTGACHWSTSTAPPPIPKIVRSPVTMWTPVAWPSTISFLAVAGTSPLSAAAKPIPLPPTAPKVRSRHWLSWASNRPGQSGMASGMRVGAAPPPACCSIRASRLTLWSAKTTSWPEAALTCSSSRIYAFRMTSPLSATITGRY